MGNGGKKRDEHEKGAVKKKERGKTKKEGTKKKGENVWPKKIKEPS